ncbi:MAG: hypothetical protein AAF628_18900 [Planctomycetota bacterium]
MSYDPRTIAFLAEVIYQPLNLKAEAVQTIHNQLYGQTEISYQNFQVAADGIHLTNVPERPGAVSAVSFTPDRMVVREELRATTVEDFATRLVNVTGLALRTLGVQATIAQQFVVRSLVSPRHAADSREFVLRKVFSAEDSVWSCFERPMQRVGLAFTFPQTEGHDHVFNVRIETWNQDPRSLWIENVGSFTKPIPVDRAPDLSNLLFATYGFATKQVTAFLEQFDKA